MAVLDVWEVKVFTKLRDQAGINVLHFASLFETGSGLTPLELAARFDGDLRAAYLPLMSDRASFHGVTVQRIRPTPPTIAAMSGLGPSDGAVTGDALPPAVSGMISLYTAVAGRSGRGRVFVPFPSEVDSTALGVPTPDYQDRLDDLGVVLSTHRNYTGDDPGNTAELACVIWHPGSSTYDEVLSFIARARWATQRRRSDFGRPNLTPFE